MGVIIVGATTGTGADVDPGQRLITTPRPHRFDNGSYRFGKETGAIAATLAANSTLYSFRWSSSTSLCLLKYIQVSVAISAAITAAVATSLEAVWARSFTVSDSGGTAFTLTGDNGKDKTTDGTNVIGDLRIATTVGLTVGTRTLDTQGFGGVAFGTGTAVGSTPLPLIDIYRHDGSSNREIKLAQNEGFIVRNADAGPATGTFKVWVNIGFIEILNANLKE